MGSWESEPFMVKALSTGQPIFPASSVYLRWFYCSRLLSIQCPLSAAPWRPQFSTSVPSRHPAHGWCCYIRRTLLHSQSFLETQTRLQLCLQPSSWFSQPSQAGRDDSSSQCGSARAVPGTGRPCSIKSSLSLPTYTRHVSPNV